MAHRRGRMVTQPFHSSVRSSHWLVTACAALSITGSVIVFLEVLQQGTSPSWWNFSGNLGSNRKTAYATCWPGLPNLEDNIVVSKAARGVWRARPSFLWIPFGFLGTEEARFCCAYFVSLGVIMMRRKKADLGGTYFMTRGISVRCAAKQPRNTAANFVSFGIIVIHCPKQARAAFANLVAMAVIVLDRTKKPGRLVIFFFVIVKVLLSCSCFFLRNQEWLWMGR